MSRPAPLRAVRSATLLAALAALLGCAARPPEQVLAVAPGRPADPPAARPAAGSVAAAVARPVAAPTDAAAHGVAVSGAASGAAPTAPAEPGASRSAFTGCLLAADEASAARFPPPPVTRVAGDPSVKVTAAPGGALVEHTLTHACCLRATVTTRLIGRTAAVLEQLGGEACRCRCGSTIRTAVALPPGTFTVTVDLEDSGGVHRVSEQPVTVR
jgi:hypothetical protein